MTAQSEAVHIITNWNSSLDFTPDTIAAHAKVLDVNREGYVWYGKMVKTRRGSQSGGISRESLERIRNQLDRDQRTCLFLYAPNDAVRRRLHAGLISDISTARPTEQHLIPDHYSRVPYECSHWFKVCDFRELSFEWLQYLFLEGGGVFDPVASNAYPLLAQLRGVPDVFDYDLTGGEKWFRFQRLHTDTPTPARKRAKAFVLMPFAGDFDNVYYAIQQTLSALGVTCERADDYQNSTRITDQVLESIRNADFVVADVTGNNANVFYELGYSEAFGKDAVLITRDRDTTPFDILGLRSIEYAPASLSALGDRLRQAVEANATKRAAR